MSIFYNSSYTGLEVDRVIGYGLNINSDIQIQLNNKQPFDADLTSIAALNSTGLVAKSGTNEFKNIEIEGTVNEIAVANGTALAATPIYLSLPDIVNIKETYIGNTTEENYAHIDEEGKVTLNGTATV